jgi:two-component system chemotaxis sensor kinase CheA
VRDGDRVIVEVTDDGGGIDLVKVREGAAQRGIASSEALAEMTDAATVELIFAPGFSTAAAVTNVSGRGVGLDAVRSAIANMGGTVAVTSQAGQGTSVRFTLPFTVMVVRVMTVDVGGQLFGLPIESVIETIQIPSDRIAPLGSAEAVVVRNRTVPLIRLSDTLDVPAGDDGRTTEANIVVVTAGGQTGALKVDGFGERMDVMLKPMEGLLAGMGGLAGTTVLGDGCVLIVLDIQELLR